LLAHGLVADELQRGRGGRSGDSREGDGSGYIGVGGVEPEQFGRLLQQFGDIGVVLQRARHAGIGADHADQPAVLDGQVDEAAQHRIGARGQGSLRLRLRDDSTQLGDRRLDDGGEDIVARLEMVVDGRLGDAEVVGDHLQGRPGKAV
jgi:hypothetical protein